MVIAALTQVARLLLYVGATLAIGHVALLLCVPRTDGSSAEVAHPQHRRRIAARGSLALVTACALLLVLQLRAMEIGLDAGEIVSLLRGTTWGRGWMLLTASAAACVVALHTRLTVPLQCIAVAALAISMGGLGHAAADEHWPIAARVTDALHVVAVGAWLGALALLWRSGATAVDAVAPTGWGAYSRVATIAAPTVVLTGFVASLLRLGSLSLGVIVGSTYGRLLFAKIAVSFVILGLGAMHRQRLIEGRALSRRSIRAEVAFAGVVLVLTSVLTGSAPPGE